MERFNILLTLNLRITRDAGSYILLFFFFLCNRETRRTQRISVIKKKKNPYSFLQWNIFKITEWSGLKGTLKLIWFHPSAMDRNTFSFQAVKATSKKALNTSNPQFLWTISTVLAYERTKSYLVVHALQNFQVWVIDTAIIIQALKWQKVNLGESTAIDCEKKKCLEDLV